MRMGKPRGDDRSPVVPVSGKGRKTEDVGHQHLETVSGRKGGLVKASHSGKVVCPVEARERLLQSSRGLGK